MSEDVKGLKKLIQNARDEAHLIEKSPFKNVGVSPEEVDIVKQKMELAENLTGYSRSKEIYSDFSAEAAKQLVMEMKFGKSSSERIRAAESLLDRHEGKPINRQLSMTVTPQDMESSELVANTKKLAAELGIAKDIDVNKLILDAGGSEKLGEAVPKSSRSKARKGKKQA